MRRALVVSRDAREISPSEPVSKPDAAEHPQETGHPELDQRGLQQRPASRRALSLFLPFDDKGVRLTVPRE